MIQGISPVQARAPQPEAAPSVQAVQAASDLAKSAAAAAASKVGPAVALSLSNVAKDDAAQGDPDHDGH